MTIYPFILYERTTGKIVTKGRAPTEHDQELQGLVFSNLGSLPIEVENVDAFYVVDGKLRDRPKLPITISQAVIRADDQEEAILSGFPKDVQVSIDETSYLVEDGQIVLTSPMAATYKLSCKHWPYLDWETTIEAVRS